MEMVQSIISSIVPISDNFYFWVIIQSKWIVNTSFVMLHPAVGLIQQSLKLWYLFTHHLFYFLDSLLSRVPLWIRRKTYLSVLSLVRLAFRLP